MARTNRLLGKQILDHRGSITFRKILCDRTEHRQTLFIQVGTGSANFGIQFLDVAILLCRKSTVSVAAAITVATVSVSTIGTLTRSLSGDRHTISVG